jgi:hypothetical protein
MIVAWVSLPSSRKPLWISLGLGRCRRGGLFVRHVLPRVQDQVAVKEEFLPKGGLCPEFAELGFVGRQLLTK